MPASRGRFANSSFATVCLLVCSAALTVHAQDLQVSVPADPIVIGRDLELALQMPAEIGADASRLNVDVAVGTAAPGPLFDDPLPLRATGQPGCFVWIAPTLPAAQPGAYPLVVTARYEDREYRWEGEVAVAFGGEWSAGRITHFVANRGLVLFLALVFLGGVLMSATPCIYPMIPITLAVLGAQAQDKGVAKSFLTALTYGLGLALVYGLIGVVSATVFSGITAFLQSPAVLVPIALLMVALSFAMFGAYELEAPAFLRNRLQGAGGQRAGFVGALLAGMVAGLVASPCVGPFLAALLLWVGTTGNVLLGFWSLFCFGLGLSALLVAVGTFPALLSNLPRSGGWMETVRKGMGLLLLYMAFYFVRPPLVLPETVFYLLLGAVTVIVAVFVGAFDRLESTSHWWHRGRKGLGILGLVAGFWLLGRVLVPTLWPPATYSAPPGIALAGAPAAEVAAALPDHVQWEVVRTGENVQALLAAKIEESQATGTPIIIDFWATWCAYCKKLDREVWNVPAVVQESLRFITIKVDATRPDDADMAAVKQMFRVPGLPTIAFIDTNGRILHGRTLSGWHDAAAVLAAMRAVP
ncbi:MAG: cytochrome c biogenesis protein CcdA [Candidatus Krumholzibacteria bacterium]|nr:cytochrome c biogenesis protein CcdA [Candidatus Krumholzibacteria bacterium]